MVQKCLFLDFDNTLSDFDQLGLQYVREVAARLVSQFGGDTHAWKTAVADTLKQLLADYETRFTGNPLAGFNLWMEQARLTFVENLCRSQRVSVPADPVAFAREIQYQALIACNAAFPGAVDALETLTQSGVCLHMASAWDSEYLDAALTGAGLSHYLGSKYGPDLVDCAKEGPEFYERIFAATGVPPTEALVVDDNPDTLRWILQTGATAIQSHITTGHHEVVPGVAAVLTDLRDLPGLVAK
jgi:FMN phosphatase YigB (HAD superfamily)